VLVSPTPSAEAADGECIRANGSQGATANISWGGYSLTNLGGATWSDGTSQTTAASTAPTFVVCASNATNTGRCDYLADGVGDQTEINAAILALPATGGLVALSDGQFNLSGAINVRSYATLQGTGITSTTLRLANLANTNAVQNTNYAAATSSQDHYVAIRNLSINGNRGGQTTPTVYGAPWSSGIVLANVSDALVENVVSYSFKMYGITVGPNETVSVGSDANVQRVIVSNLEAYDNGDDGVQVNGNNVTDVLVINSRSHHNPEYLVGVSASGFEVNDGPQRISFLDDLAYNNADQGFEVHTHDNQATPRDVSFINTVSMNQTNGYSVTKAWAAAPADPWHRNIAYTNAQSFNNTYGWHLGSVDGLVIQGGSSQGDVNGLWFSGSQEVRSVTVDGWTAVGRGAAGAWNDTGVMFFSATTATDVTIQNSRISNSAGAGIFTAATAVFSNLRIIDNVLKNNGQTLDADDYRAGITLKTAGSVEVYGNLITDDQAVKTQTYAIIFNNYTGTGYFRNNNFQGNLTSTVGASAGALPAPQYFTRNLGYRDAQWTMAAEPFTIADNGAGTAATATLQFANALATITCNDADGCDVTVGENTYTMGDGELVHITNVSANTVNFADTAGVTELAGVFAMGQYDSLVLMYVGDRWIEVSRSNN